MKSITDYSDTRQKTWCIHCHRSLSQVRISHDHVPSKCLLALPFPANLPVIQICEECNKSHSLDEEYLMILLEVVLAGSTDPSCLSDTKIAKKLTEDPGLRSRIEKSKIEHQTIQGEMEVVWEPEIERVSRVVLKNARGHAMYEYGLPMLHEPNQVGVFPLLLLNEGERIEFEKIENRNGIFPEVGSRMMSRVILGHDLQNDWVMVQEGRYRYAVTQESAGLRVRSVIREYLATDVIWE